ncbi:MAG: radical SAM family heme chaperone HemW [Chloroflexota bacterium]|nr:radical SAM family heme chaperone HemW [Chloroflexota bacterium]
MKRALYIHVPFCLQRCTYCDFNTYAGLLPLRAAYVDALEQEAALWEKRYPDLQVATLYFGGGTPSLLSPASVARLVNVAHARFALPVDAEVTLEANPGTVDEPQLQALRQAGVNRLSLGVQSSHREELALLGRIHSWEEAVSAVKAARRAGFTNVSLDLIFGLPGQSLARWEKTVERVLTLQPEHLSLYALKLEPRTPLAKQVAAGELPTPEPDLAADMYERAGEFLQRAGFWQYEISNWARGRTSAPEIWAVPPAGQSEQLTWVARHNLIYWRNTAWVGWGAGAYSWFQGRRWSNPAHPHAYIAAVGAGELQRIAEEHISLELEMGETLMMGLRLAEGVTALSFRARFGIELFAQYGDVIARFVGLGLLAWDEKRLRLTCAGRLLGNQVFAAFLP